ncbi:hypothetical protein ZIOFF_002371 [Zingiber officinale]|uniref:Uncharacterized protein n=1 Tax=Zingiber officinale TaxID=94328 RepID=A0A8J5LST9_ZINOF|nr:hypothetical protein ZIOFF_002371 [Zingiber officinale]
MLRACTNFCRYVLGAGLSTQAVSLANQGQYAPAVVPGGFMQLRPTSLAPQPIPIGAPSGPMQGNATEDENMKMQAERAGRAGGWTIELSKRRAIEEAYNSLWI